LVAWSRTRATTSSGSFDLNDLVAELEYRDPNGETLTAATRVAISEWPPRVKK